MNDDDINFSVRLSKSQYASIATVARKNGMSPRGFIRYIADQLKESN